MLVLSHRGYHVRAPENTIEAFARAVDLGVDGIETDLRVARDGAVVLFHDRQTSVPTSAGQREEREVADLTHAELSAAVGYPVPTLDEALGAFEGLLWNLEIKVPAALEPCLAAVKKFSGARRRFLVTSFWHDVVARFADQLDSLGAARDNVQCGLLTADRPLALEALVGAGHARFDAIVWFYDILDEALLKEARSRGIANHVYGVRSVADHRRCLDWGLDGVITDRPELMAQARAASA